MPGNRLWVVVLNGQMKELNVNDVILSYEMLWDRSHAVENMNRDIGWEPLLRRTL